MARARTWLLVVLLGAICLPAQAQGHGGQPPDMFKQLPKGHWSYSAIRWTATTGLLEGYPRGFFSPGRGMTRYEVAVALQRVHRLLVGVRQRAATSVLESRTAAPGYRELDFRALGLLLYLTREFRAELSSLGERTVDMERNLRAFALAAVADTFQTGGTGSLGLATRTAAAGLRERPETFRLGMDTHLRVEPGEGTMLSAWRYRRYLLPER